MKAANLASKLKSQGRDATRIDANTVAVRTTQARLIPESVALLRETGWSVVGEYDPETGACRVVLRVQDAPYRIPRSTPMHYSAAPPPGFDRRSKVAAVTARVTEGER